MKPIDKRKEFFDMLDDYTNGIYFELDPKRYNGTSREDLRTFVEENFVPREEYEELKMQLPKINTYVKDSKGLSDLVNNGSTLKEHACNCDVWQYRKEGNCPAHGGVNTYWFNLT